MKNQECIKHERFCQFRREIRGSKEHLIVGIDIAKDKHYAFFGTSTGKTLFKRLIFDNNLEGYKKLLARVDALKVQHCLSKVVFGLEPTGNYHKPLGAYLVPERKPLFLFRNSKSEARNPKQ